MISVVDVAASNANIFADYILPSLHSFSTDSEVMVRVTFAKCISSLVETALRFLEISQVVSSKFAYWIRLNSPSLSRKDYQDAQAIDGQRRWRWPLASGNCVWLFVLFPAVFKHGNKMHFRRVFVIFTTFRLASFDFNFRLTRIMWLEPPFDSYLVAYTKVIVQRRGADH